MFRTGNYKKSLKSIVIVLSLAQVFDDFSESFLIKSIIYPLIRFYL